MKKYTIITSPTNNGDVSEVFYNEETPIADDLQTNCNGIADDLQTKCSQPAIEDSTPNRSFRRPSPLKLTEDIAEVLKFLNDKKYIQDLSKGMYENIWQAMGEKGNQKGLPIWIVKDLREKGMTVSGKPINNDNSRREVVPLLIIQKKDNQLAKAKKINLILFVSLILTLIIFLTKSPTYPTAQSNNENAVIITDSVLTAAELHKYITEYTKLTNTKIYPYSENIILNRVNQKGLTSINEIKNEIETRLKEISTR